MLILKMMIDFEEGAERAVETVTVFPMRNFLTRRRALIYLTRFPFLATHHAV